MFSTLKKIAISGIVGVFLAVVALPIVTSAQQTSGNGLLISPTRTEITGNPGETKEFSISVKNVTEGEVTAKAFVNDFESDGATGSPKIITDDRRTPYTINDMLKGLSDIELKPGEAKTVNLSLVIGSNVSPGAYFGAVRYAAVPKNQDANKDQQVSLTASVAHLVFLNVPGTIVEQISLDKLTIADDKGSTGVLFRKPTKSSITVKNLGNGFSRPFGTISITSGKKEVYKSDVNKTDPKGIVLPNSTRVFEDKVEGISKPGKYTAVASVAYGNGGEVVNYSTTFWYLPVWFVIVLVVIALAVILGAYYIYRKVAGKKSSKK